MSQPAALRPGPSALAQNTQHSRPLPRRVPSHQSVSIRHSKPVKETTDSSPDSGPGLETSSLANNRNSSGESSSNADAWFEQTNENGPNSGTAIADGDSPFFLQQSSTDSQDAPRNAAANATSQLHRLPLGKRHSSEDSTEEYRSVIDDLTIQNKKLKSKLKKFQKMSDSKVGSDKLFEVRVHGLSTSKKRELQETLEKFAMNLHDSSADNSNQPSPATLQVSGVMDKPSSSHTSTRVADSGYGSLATSGRGSSAQQSNAATSGSRDHQSTADFTKARDQSIRSYLHDIPESLLPQKSSAMTEKAKKKLIVRRLEQVFGGKGATPDGHQQPQQQQELSQIAAKHDRTALEAQGQVPAAEGKREANIMENETEDPMDFTRTSRGSEKTPDKQVDETDFATASHSAEEQRPTRPLDLDLHRAQVPTENLEYFRHLGFTVPDIYTKIPASETGGWLYLNLLINMAQLHTINVTPEFVKHAIKDYSQKFELSADGRKIRWKGDQNPTHSSSNTGSSETSSYSNVDQDPENTKKRHRPSTFESTSSSDTGLYPSKKVALPSESDNPFSYKPLFPHQRSSDEESAMDGSTSLTASPYHPETGNSSAFASSAKHSSSHSRRKDDAPIIFYNNAKFCIDMSGEKRRGKKSSLKFDYSPIATSPMGLDRTARSSFKEPQYIKDRPLNNASPDGLASPSGVSTDPMEDVQFPVVPSPRRVTFEEPMEPAHLEASGLGGVRPDDNFVIGVVKKFTRTNNNIPKSCLVNKVNTQDARDVMSHTVRESVLSSRKKTLPPSNLPPASYAMDPYDSDSETDEENPEINLDEYANAEALQTEGADDSDVSDEESISSTSPEVVSEPSDAVSDGRGDVDDEVDFLAQARKIDPETIRAREREYDAEMAERLADEIPAGSSAATAGGGSGFASPVEMAKMARGAMNAKEANNKIKALKRRNGTGSDSDESADDEEEEIDDGVERSIAS